MKRIVEKNHNIFQKKKNYHIVGITTKSRLFKVGRSMNLKKSNNKTLLNFYREFIYENKTVCAYFFDKIHDFEFMEF